MLTSGRSLLRQWDELLFIPGHECKAFRTPIGLGLLDPLLGRGDKIPPDVTGSIHRIPTQKHEPGLRKRQHRNAVSRPEDQQPSLAERGTGDVDFTRGDIDRPFVMIGVKWQYRPWREHGFGKQRGVWKFDR